MTNTETKMVLKVLEDLAQAGLADLMLVTLAGLEISLAISLVVAVVLVAAGHQEDHQWHRKVQTFKLK